MTSGPSGVGDLSGIAPVVGTDHQAGLGQQAACRQLGSQGGPVDAFEVRIALRRRGDGRAEPVEPDLDRYDREREHDEAGGGDQAAAREPALAARHRLAEQREQHQVAGRRPMEQHALAGPRSDQREAEDRRGRRGSTAASRATRRDPRRSAAMAARQHRDPDPRQHEQRLAGQDHASGREDGSAARRRAHPGRRRTPSRASRSTPATGAKISAASRTASHGAGRVQPMAVRAAGQQV